MIFVGVVGYLAREVGRGRWSSYVLRSEVECSADAALRVEQACGKARPAGMARKGHVWSTHFPCERGTGSGRPEGVHHYITAVGGVVSVGSVGAGRCQKQEQEQEQERQRQRQPRALNCSGPNWIEQSEQARPKSRSNLLRMLQQRDSYGTLRQRQRCSLGAGRAWGERVVRVEYARYMVRCSQEKVPGYLRCGASTYHCRGGRPPRCCNVHPCKES